MYELTRTVRSALFAAALAPLLLAPAAASADIIGYDSIGTTTPQTFSVVNTYASAGCSTHTRPNSRRREFLLCSTTV
jgi:hypothetical protein